MEKLLSVTVNPGAPSQPGEIAGNPTQCENGKNITYSISDVSYASTFNWGVPSGWNIISGQNSILITVDAGVFGQNGNITVIAENSCGASPLSSLAVSVNSLPTVVDVVDGSRCGAGSVSIEASTASGKINWYNAAFGGDLRGSSPTWITDSVPATIKYYAEAESPEGCYSLVREPVEAIILDYPVVNLGNDTTICADDSTSFNAVNGTAWRWSNGDSTQVITVHEASDYHVAVTDANGCIGYDTINLSTNALPTIDLGNDTSICLNNFLIISTDESLEVEWNTLDTAGSIIVFSANEYSVKVKDENGCVNYDTINVSINPLPVVDLGNDSAICLDSNLVLNPKVGVSWLWNNGDTTQALLVNTAGDYEVTVADANGCENDDEINLSINPLPQVELGEDTAICIGEIITFDAEVGEIWLWNNGEETKTTNVNTAGDYSITVTDENGCVNYDTILLGIHSLPDVELGGDTSICKENNYLIHSNAPTALTYLWNNGSRDSELESFGKLDYSVIVTDSNECVNYDTIQIDTFESPKVVINIQDTAICFGDSVKLEVAQDYNFYAWTNTSSITNSTIVSATNKYILRAFDANGCLGVDTTDLLVYDLPNIDLGDSARYCEFKEMSIDIAEENAQYLWSTGGTNKSESIFAVGRYWADVTDTNNCFNSDSVWVHFGGRVPVDLGEDTTICEGTSLVLNASFINKEIWQSIDTSDTYTVRASNQYDVLVIDSDGCFGRDTILVSVSEVPKVEIVQGDSIPICERASEGKHLSILNVEEMDVLWNTGEHQDRIQVSYTDQFIVQKTNNYGCVGWDTAVVFEMCLPVVLSMPNVFTPDNDGINENFIPIEAPTESLDFILANTMKMNFKVLNRWGRPVFMSSAVLPNWDGRNIESGKECAVGTYYWMLEYGDVSGGNYQLNGFVQLIRL